MQIIDWVDIAAWTIAISTVVVLITQIIRERRVRRGEILLRLRTEFSKKKRASVHHALTTGEWDAGVPANRWRDIDDYLGLFEICAQLIRDRVITLKIFANFYEYRVHNVLSHREIVQSKLIDEQACWPSLIWLVDVLLKNGYLSDHQDNDKVMRILELASREFEG